MTSLYGTIILHMYVGLLDVSSDSKRQNSLCSSKEFCGPNGMVSLGILPAWEMHCDLPTSHIGSLLSASHVPYPHQTRTIVVHILTMHGLGMLACVGVMWLYVPHHTPGTNNTFTG